MAFSKLIDALSAQATVVTVNNRLARRLRQVYGEQCRAAGQGVWETPVVLPFGAWLMQLYEARQDAVLSGAPPVNAALLTAGQADIVWTRLIRASKLSEGLLQPTAVADTASAAWRLCQTWRIPLERLASGNEDCATFAVWAREYQAVCERKHWLDSARLADWLSGELEHIPLPERIVLAGFDEWTPQQTALLEVVAAQGVQVEYDEAASVASTTAVQTLRADNADAELQMAAQWAANRLHANPVQRIGIVVPDLTTRREAAVRAVAAAIDPAALAPSASTPLPVNVSVGVSLDKTPVIHDALLALDCRLKTLELETLSQLLLSPFIGAAATEAAQRAALDIKLRDRGEAQVSDGTLRYYADKTGCKRWLRGWAAFRRRMTDMPRRAMLHVWAEIMQSLLSALGWPGERTLNSDEYQTIEAFHDVLADFAALEQVVDQPVSFNTALNRLRRLAAQREFQPRHPEAPVQVLGTLEAAVLDFDALWITGMEDRKWPARPEPNAFIPLAVQREYGLPRASADRELALSRAVTQRLFAAAPEVMASWPGREGDLSLQPSPLLGESRLVEKAGDAGWPHATADWREAIHAAAVLETLSDSQAPALDPQTLKHGGTGLLKDQAACPFRAFAHYRLNTQAPASPESGLDASLRGTLVHAALVYFWEAVGDHATLSGMDTAAQLQATREAVSKTLDEELKYRHGGISPRLRELEHARLVILLTEWLECELQRAPFRVLAQEQPAELSVGGLTLNMRLDRVDRLDSGGEAVIDYKTGPIKANAWEGERPDEPQLPAYAVLGGSEVSAVLFANLRRGESMYKGVADDMTGIKRLYKGIDEIGIGELQQEWQQTLENLATAFREGQAEVDPKNKDTCQYCDLATLCRIAEHEHGD